MTVSEIIKESKPLCKEFKFKYLCSILLFIVPLLWILPKLPSLTEYSLNGYRKKNYPRQKHADIVFYHCSIEIKLGKQKDP